MKYSLYVGPEYAVPQWNYMIVSFEVKPTKNKMNQLFSAMRPIHGRCGKNFGLNCKITFSIKNVQHQKFIDEKGENITHLD